MSVKGLSGMRRHASSSYGCRSLPSTASFGADIYTGFRRAAVISYGTRLFEISLAALLNLPGRRLISLSRR
jgi:hypothetical protein